MNTQLPAQLALAQLDWNKGEAGLLPAIVQDYYTGRVLMLGYMNREALAKTLDSKQVTFFSRNKQRLWTKGETTGHVLNLVDIHVDCDNDTLLITANPVGPTCHTGTITCWGDEPVTAAEQIGFLSKLESVIAQRIAENPEGSYTAKLWERGLTRMAQKVGEEGVEIALAAVVQEEDRLISEAADMLYHLTLLLKARNLSLGDVVKELEQRHKAKP
jgi:phosphoribosyl-AMP cyclohydrolase / phosphoribosyl-ATP pyrophosphohydrolase